MKKLILLVSLTVLAIAFFIFLSLLVSCRAPKPIYVPIHDSTAVEATETITDYPTWTIPDSAYWALAFECDSNYNVLLKQFDAMNTGLRESVRIEKQIEYREDKTRVKKLQVNISVYSDSIQSMNRTIEKLRKEKKIVEVPVEVPGPEVKFIPQRFKWYRNVLLLIVLSGLGYVVIKYKLWKVFIK